MAPTQERLKEVLSYDPKTGIFTWKIRTSNRIRVGDVAGCHDTHYGYVLIGIDGVVYSAHQLAVLYVTGVFPVEVDHENGNRKDNRFDNLRDCEHSQNQKNVRKPKHNTSGFKGVHYHRESGLWRARICADGRHHSLGLHSTKELAHAAYREGAVRHHGEFARFE